MTNEELIAYAEQASLEAGNPACTTVVLTAGNNLCSDRGDWSGKGILSALKEKGETQVLKAVTVGLKGATLVDNVVTGGTECIISRPLGAL